jgi:hypothetical protein
MNARAQAAPPQKSIFDPPPKRENPAMTPAERLKMQQELNAARDRQGRVDDRPVPMRRGLARCHPVTPPVGSAGE